MLRKGKTMLLGMIDTLIILGVILFALATLERAEMRAEIEALKTELEMHR